ncbi:hypothetical protein GPL15_25915 [Clostridium sp. MCC353]|uniref:hypothetical protein n=1 Tax=Clostridium sp. MCC353 TaxID=2592646 RepID=UPI001C027ED7|nr:hypothetical protein [Clostridium sp. MCC353]MBT9779911.1 hypothetical protein [Clostridium sp. MCC353]
MRNSESYAETRGETAAGGLGFGDWTGGMESGGDENRLPAVRETKAPGIEKDGPMPIHGELFMGLHRSVGISETDLVFSFCPSFSIPAA